MRHRVLGITLAALCICPAAWAETYAIDPDHTTVEFRIRHLFSHVRGTFDKFDGTIDYVPDHPEQWKTTATIQADSINTRVPQRDKHLRSKDFFEVETYPTIMFTTTEVTDATPTAAKVHGLLTIHGVQRPVVLDVEIHGVAKDPWGNVRAGFTGTTTINRKDFGLVWNQALESGQLLVGEEVEIVLEIEGIQKS